MMDEVNTISPENRLPPVIWLKLSWGIFECPQKGHFGIFSDSSVVIILFRGVNVVIWPCLVPTVHLSSEWKSRVWLKGKAKKDDRCTPSSLTHTHTGCSSYTLHTYKHTLATHHKLRQAPFIFCLDGWLQSGALCLSVHNRRFFQFRSWR